MPVVAVANQKGGVGKTTCCVNLAAELGKRGHLILVVDMDPQAHSTSGLGVDKSALKYTTYDVLINDVSIEEIIICTPWQGVSVI
ncbi:MAG: AAA family ATPase, partial [Synergistales bacterium]|nr:AAA family ATPase [Synergistales bacterium]